MENEKEEKPETIFSIAGFIALFFIFWLSEYKKRKSDEKIFNKQLRILKNEKAEKNKKEN